MSASPKIRTKQVHDKGRKLQINCPHKYTQECSAMYEQIGFNNK